MSKMNLGFEALGSGAATEEFMVTDEFLIEMEQESTGIVMDLSEARESIEGVSNLLTVFATIGKHGGYAGYEDILSEKAQLDALVGCDICTCSAESFRDLIAEEAVREKINAFLVKINAFLGRIGDRVNNFIKTTLPYKEKYLKEMTDLKQSLAGKNIDEEKFKASKVGSALSKDKYSMFATNMAKFQKTAIEFVTKMNASTPEKLLNALDDIPEHMRTSFGDAMFSPFFSWFKTGKLGDLGFSAKDVNAVLDAGIGSIKAIADMNGAFGQFIGTVKKLETQIGHKRAEGDVAGAIDDRENIARMQEFIFQYFSAINTYEQLVRRFMYFCTYTGRAAKKAIVAE